MKPDPKDPARLRQSLRQTEEQRAALVEALLGERGPLIRGTYRRQGGRCGRPGCRCNRGELHEKAMLYRREGGVFRCTYVPLADRERVKRQNHGYRRASSSRTGLAKLGKQSLELADALQEALIEPYPPLDRPERKPGRPRKKRRSHESSS